jgi:hypothetical protein
MMKHEANVDVVGRQIAACSCGYTWCDRLDLACVDLVFVKYRVHYILELCRCLLFLSRPMSINEVIHFSPSALSQQASLTC